MKTKPILYVLSALLFTALLSSTGCRKDRSVIEDAAVPRLHLEVRGGPGTGGVTNIRMPISGSNLSVMQEPLVSEFEITNIELVQVELGYAVLIQMSEMASRRLYRASVERHGSRVALIVSGVPVGLRLLDGPIQDGNFFTFVELDDEQTEDLVLDMRETLIEIHRKARR